MTWKDVGKAIGKAAPLLGSAFGPLGSAAGAIVSTALGVENEPDAIVKAVSASPEAALRLREIESANRVELEKAVLQAETARLAEETKRILAVNTTMQKETAHGGFSGFWRPFWGVISALAFAVVAVFVCFLAYEAIVGGKPEALNMIPQLVSSVALLFSIPGAILGVTAWHRGKMQRIQAGDAPAKGIAAAIAERIAK